MRRSLVWLLLVVANVALFAGVFIFAVGFFPYKPFLPGLSVFDSQAEPVPAPFNKVIFIVIDALRSDFVYSNRSNFHFTQSLISSGAAVPFTAHAGSPTITMPRIKSMTTGSIPGFLDLILNFAESDTTSTLANQDNWPAQIKARGGKLVFYGDDTWLKLLPETFYRSEGVTSFFVSDFVEVDNNVTRHVDSELRKDDWDALVLHYLGLDHVGHKAGPQSAFMAPKQAEMDGIIRRIYTALEEEAHLQSALLVLCGDHGMNDAGGHGGSTPGESSAALLFSSPNFRNYLPGLPCPAQAKGEFTFYEKVEQPDIVPTLAGLLQFPIPRNNLGRFIPSFLNIWNDEKHKVQIVLQNALQILQLVKATYPSLDNVLFAEDCSKNPEAAELACLWAKASAAQRSWTAGEQNAPSVIESLEKFTKRSQDILAMAASNYDLKMMMFGMIALGIGALSSMAALSSRLLEESKLSASVFPVLALLYAVMMFASSFVEEEQNFWYWVSAGWCFALFVKEKKLGLRGISPLSLLALGRLIRRWNQTGQKHSGAPDIVTDFLLKHTSIMWVAIIGTYIYSWYRLRGRLFRRLGQSFGVVLAATIATAAAAFKLSFALQDAAEAIPPWLKPVSRDSKQLPLASQARAVFLSLFLALSFTILFEKRSLRMSGKLRLSVVILDILTVFLATQSRFYNVPLLLLYGIQYTILDSMTFLSTFEILLTSLIFQHAAFFSLGGSNNISSIDLSNVLNGLTNYNVLIAGPLTFLSNWVGPIFFSTAGMVLLREKNGRPYLEQALLFTAFWCVAGLAVMVSCTALRTHLFIWTVFSPKYIYTMIWSILHHMVINLGWGALVYRANGVVLE